MPPKGIGRIGGAPPQVVVDGRLLAQRLTRPDPAGPFTLGLPNPARGRQHLLGTLGGDEHHAVVVAKTMSSSLTRCGPNRAVVSASGSRWSSRTGPGG
jgi:hypothetical protein